MTEPAVSASGAVPDSDKAGPGRKQVSNTRTSRVGARAWSWLLILAILVFSTGNVYLGYDAQRSLTADYEALQQVNRDTILLDSVRLLIVDAETGQRGYLLTREPSYREPYDRAIRLLRDAMVQLRERLRTYPSVQQLYGPLEAAIDAKVQELASTLRYAEENDFNAGPKITEENRGQQYMENIRAASDAINSGLETEARILQAARTRKQNRAITALLAAATASVVLLWALVALGRRETIRKEQMNELLITRNEQLDAAVRERTRELVQANEQFDRSNRELENFAYVVSHDLQEPLRKIRAFGGRLTQTQDRNLSERSLDYIDRMQSAAARMSTLLNDLLLFSRVNTRGLDYSQVDLGGLVRTAIEDLELIIEEKSAEIEVDDLPEVRGDYTQLRQLFQNILANGLKFQDNNQAPRIVINSIVRKPADGESAEVRIDISDNGIGFEERYLDRIFDPFQRLHGRTEFDGSGIGLAICRRVAERHGGSLTARSSPGRGSVFTITLPLDAEAAVTPANSDSS